MIECISIHNECEIVAPILIFTNPRAPVAAERVVISALMVAMGTMYGDGAPAAGKHDPPGLAS